jgi:predicted O-methyltransferase YrrM
MINQLLDPLRSRLQKRRLEKWYRTRGLESARDIPTHMTEPEKVALYELAVASRSKGDVVEVGSYVGASSCYLSAALKDSGGRLYCVDTWNNETMPDGVRDTYQEFMLNTRAFRDVIVPLRKKSDGIARSDFGPAIGLVFLDGDHSYESVSREFAMFSGWLSSGSIIALHDILYFEGVVKTYCEAVSSGSWIPKGQTNNLIWLEKR